MRCLNAKIEYIKNPLNITTHRINQIIVNTYYTNRQLMIETKLNDLLSINVVNLNELLKIHINDIANLNVYCYRVCASHSEYLTVTPNMVWLTPDMLSGEFDIYSNVSWKID